MARGPRRSPRIGSLRNIYYARQTHSVVVIRKGHRYSRNFSNRVWGGRAKSRIAAQRWLYVLLKEISADTRVRQKASRGSTSKTGIVGVSHEHYRVEGRSYERFVACWPDLAKGGQRRKFSIRRYGQDQARALAKAARKAGVARYDAQMRARQREEAAQRLRRARPQPQQVKDPLSRKGISMAARGPRRVGQATS